MTITMFLLLCQEVIEADPEVVIFVNVSRRLTQTFHPLLAFQIRQKRPSSAIILEVKSLTFRP